MSVFVMESQCLKTIMIHLVDKSDFILSDHDRNTLQIFAVNPVGYFQLRTPHDKEHVQFFENNDFHAWVACNRQNSLPSWELWARL